MPDSDASAETAHDFILQLDHPHRLNDWIQCPNCHSQDAGLHEHPDGEVVVKCPDCGDYTILTPGEPLGDQ